MYNRELALLHPVHRENMQTCRGAAKYRMVASDVYGMNPNLIGYSDDMPTQRRLAQFKGHYATLIYAMPREVDVAVNAIEE